MSSVKIEFETANKPDNFPSAEEILNQWKTRLALAKAADSGGDIRGVSLVDSAGQPYAWLKFGSNVTMAEARTQHYVAQVVNGDAYEGPCRTKIDNLDTGNFVGSGSRSFVAVPSQSRRN
jgi:hypothetical protein